MGRHRLRIVPPDAVECFEVRISLFITPEGETRFGYSISDPDTREVWPLLHEVLGTVEAGKALIIQDYDAEPVDDDG